MSAVEAHDYSVGTMSIGHPWIPLERPSAASVSVYMTVENLGSEPDRLMGATSPVAQRIELHSIHPQGTATEMNSLEDGIDIPPGATVPFQPGGYHLILVAPLKTFEEKDTVPINLNFQNAGDLDVAVEVVGTVSASESGENGEASERHDD